LIGLFLQQEQQEQNETQLALNKRLLTGDGKLRVVYHATQMIIKKK